MLEINRLYRIIGHDKHRSTMRLIAMGLAIPQAAFSASNAIMDANNHFRRPTKWKTNRSGVAGRAGAPGARTNDSPDLSCGMKRPSHHSD